MKLEQKLKKMTPKEKASEMFNKFFNLYPNQDAQFIAIECCLISVNELIESHLLLTTTHDKEPTIRCKRYWQEVKEEIEALYKP